MMSASPLSRCLIQGQSAVPKTFGQIRPLARKEVVVNIDDWHLRFARVDGPTMLALAQFLVAIELFKERRQVPHNALQSHLRPVDEVMALGAIPLKCIQGAFWARHLNNDAQAACLPLRRMTHVFRQQKYVSFSDWNLHWRLARSFHDAQKDVSLQLIKILRWHHHDNHDADWGRQRRLP